MDLKKGVKRMKVTLEFVIRDDKGNILSQNSPLTLEIGTQKTCPKIHNPVTVSLHRIS